MKDFKSIIEFSQYFNNDEVCRQFLEEQRWGDTPACPHCGSTLAIVGVITSKHLVP